MDPGKSEGPVATRATTSEHHHLSRTVARPTDNEDYARGFIAGWCDRAEYARRGGLTFDDGLQVGYEAGVRAADRAMRNHIAAVTAGMPEDAAQVVHRLVRHWEVPGRRAEADRPGARPGDWPGVAA